MALQKYIELDSGVILENAYIRISTIYFYNRIGDNSYVQIDVTVHKDLQARLDEKPEVTKFTYKCAEPAFTNYFSLTALNVANVNLISQAYNWLKTMSLYSVAVDIHDSKE